MVKRTNKLNFWLQLDDNCFNSNLENEEVSLKKNKWIFIAFMILVIADRWISLNKFGFIYTDIDQVILWNAAIDYSKGIFHEPYFYGQNYNYMLEAFLAVPFVWLKLPIYKALPIVTSFLALLPFISLAFLFYFRKYYFWAILTLSIPVLLPSSYGFLTSISRGFIQANLFIPLLLPVLSQPKSIKFMVLFFISFGACLIFNPSTLFIVLPIAFWIWMYNWKNPFFYIQFLILIPFLIVDSYSRHYYEVHLEKVLLKLSDVYFSKEIFFSAFKNKLLFQDLFLFKTSWGILYLPVFILLTVTCMLQKKVKETLVMLCILTLLLITFAIVKVQYVFEGNPFDYIFYTTSRFYILLPFLLIFALFFNFNKLKFANGISYFLFIFTLGFFGYKMITIEQEIKVALKHSTFPVAKITYLRDRDSLLLATAKKHDIDLIVNSAYDGWDYYFDVYTLPFFDNSNNKNETVLSISSSQERRTWLFEQAEYKKRILLNGIKIDTTLLNSSSFERINENQILLFNNNQKVSEIFKKLHVEYGNKVRSFE